ncbi:MAG: DUF4127 family protein [Candidatus Sericytochromatia bacterium]
MPSVLLPLDGRPCNVAFPVALAGLAEHVLEVPPVAWLGDARQAARHDRLDPWLERHAAEAEQLFLSLDTWIYGNLVASRKTPASLEHLLGRIERLRALKASHPALRLQGFATLLRLSNSHDDTEERAYWARFGKEIYRYSWLSHALESLARDAALPDADPVAWRAELSELEALIPSDVLADYRALRARNLAVLEALLEAVSEGVLETLLIGCDDGGAYGWTRQERDHLLTRIEDLQLSERVLIYPGADELACVLLARVLRPEPLPVHLHWTYPESRQQVTRYEGLPLEDTLAFQARAAGVVWSDEAAQQLWVHNPPHEQIDQYLDREHRVQTPPRHWLPLFSLLASGASVALADVCYANGGDRQLLEALDAQQLTFDLQAYAAWNTAGNTLGMILAWLKLLPAERGGVRQQRFLIERLADDGWYQGHLRQQLCGHYSEPVTLNSCVQGIAWFNQRFREWLTWMPNAPETLEILRLNFPWRRFFEVELQVCFKKTNDASAEDRCLK